MTRESPGDCPTVADVEAFGQARGLTRLCALLSELGVVYWVDSGVLLGLVRSGGLNPWEKDIDLAVLEDQVDPLLESIPSLAPQGYTVGVNRYRGWIYTISLKPNHASAEDELRAGIHVYYRVGDYLWSPQTQLYVPPPAPDIRQKPLGLVGKMMRRLLTHWLYSASEGEDRGSRAPREGTIPYRVARWAYRRFDNGWLAETWPVSEVYASMAWVIPRHLVEPVREMAFSGITLPVPADVEGYLTYRYGDWRTPVKSWCYWEDDGAIRRDNPLALRKQLEKGLMETDSGA